MAEAGLGSSALSQARSAAFGFLSLRKQLPLLANIAADWGLSRMASVWKRLSRAPAPSACSGRGACLVDEASLGTGEAGAGGACA